MGMELVLRELLDGYDKAQGLYAAAKDAYTQKMFEELRGGNHDFDLVQRKRDEAFEAYQLECRKLAAFVSSNRDSIKIC